MQSLNGQDFCKTACLVPDNLLMGLIWHIKLAVSRLLSVSNEEVSILISNMWMLFAKYLKLIFCTYDRM